MPMYYKPRKDDKSKFDIKCDYAELASLRQRAQDLATFGQMMSKYSEITNRRPGFWDEEFGVASRMISSLVWPFEDFFSQVMRADGDLEVYRQEDPKKQQHTEYRVVYPKEFKEEERA